MIHLLCGPSGSGKSTLLLKRMADVLNAGGHAYLLVPEQEAVARERAVMQALPTAAQLRFEVFNFSRLANHAFRTYGGIGYRSITSGGRALAMWQTLRALSPFLQEYGERAKNDAALTAHMRSAIAECKAYAITPDRLEQAAGQLAPDAALRRKLLDLAAILGAYDARIAERWQDSENDLLRLANLLDEHQLFAGADVFIDSFTDFTAAEYAVLSRICAQAKSVTFALCCDKPTGTALHFTELSHTAAALRRMAAHADIPVRLEVLTENHRAEDSTLGMLADRLWQMEDASPLPDSAAVELYSCASPYAEAEAAAARIAALVREGMRYRDIVLIVRSTDGWRGILDAELERAGIPYFLSQRSDITTKPTIKLLLSALSLRKANWRLSDLLSYLKTGCTGLAREEVDLLEDYLTRWQLQGSSITAASGWTMDPDGYVTTHTPRAAALLEQLNILRQRVTSPLLTFFDRLDCAETAAECASAVYTYLNDVKLLDQLNQRIAEESERGRAAEASELIQLWNILLDALDQIVTAFGDDPCSADEFADALRLVFAETDIGTIPTSADQVTIGSAAMLRADSPRCAILLGLCEGEFPQAITDAGFFTDADKRVLEGIGLDLSPSGDRRAAAELFYLYRAISAPCQRLICLCHRADADGREVLPSLGFTRICRLLGRQGSRWEDLPPIDRLWSRETAFPYTAMLDGTPEGAALREIFSVDPDYADRTRALDSPITERDCRLSPETASALFGQRMQLSQSRIDRYVSCHFAYFCRYLLGLREEEPAQIGYDSVGSYVHAVLERFFRALTVDGKLCLPEDDARLDEQLSAAISCYLNELLDGVPHSARITHLFHRLHRLSRLLVNNLLTEFRQSGFVPVFFELPIRRGSADSPDPLVFDLPDGTPVWIGGIIDRVDLWQREDGRAYLRVVDYKTGSKTFDRSDIDIGFNLQLLLYLFTLCRSQSPSLRHQLGLAHDAELHPAGMLYCTALAPDFTAEADAASEDIVRQADSALSRLGIVLDDEEVLRAMDTSLSGKYIPCRLLKKGGFNNPQSRATAEEFDQLYDQLGQTIRRVAGEMHEGRANARPRRRDGKYLCETCSAKPICRAAKK